jgi:hypothetical protein
MGKTGVINNRGAWLKFLFAQWLEPRVRPTYLVSMSSPPADQCARSRSHAKLRGHGRCSAYSSELNPVENVWEYLRQNRLSNRVFESYDAIVDACCHAWNALTAEPGRIRSIATRPWASVIV